MSDQANDAYVENLLDRASHLITYFEGRLPAEVMEADIERQDWEALDRHVRQSEAEQHRLEYSPEEVEATDVY